MFDKTSAFDKNFTNLKNTQPGEWWDGRLNMGGSRLAVLCGVLFSGRGSGFVWILVSIETKKIRLGGVAVF